MPSRQAPDHDEQSVRGITGSGSSQLSRAQAMRSRDVNRPTPADLAEAEDLVQVVRRNWRPSDG